MAVAAATEVAEAATEVAEAATEVAEVATAEVKTTTIVFAFIQTKTQIPYLL
jgi:uncharacterized protein with PhoU and TrkA domain